MLKIAVTDRAEDGISARLDGRIGGPWVEALREACAGPLAAGRALALDLAGVSYVDGSGMALLEDLVVRGARIVNCSRFVAEQFHAGRAMLATDTVTRAPSPLPPSPAGALVREHGPRMFSVAWHFLRGPVEAREAVHEAWLHALREDGGQADGEALGRRLEDLTTRAAMMRLRSASQGPDEDIEPLLPRFDERGHWRGEPPRAFDGPDEDEAESRLWEALERLPLQYRGPVVLRELTGLSLAEAAAALGVDEAAVARRRHLALEALCALVHAGVPAPR